MWAVLALLEVRMSGNGRKPGDDQGGNQDNVREEEASGALNPSEYDALLRLEQLESLEEDMQDLGVTTLDEVRRLIAELHRQLDDAE